jgi:hypothetical protein
MTELTREGAQADLAFLRSLVASGDGIQRPLGEAYLAAGLCYGAEFVLTGAQAAGLIPSDPFWSLLLGFGPTVAFAIALTFIIIASRRRGGVADGPTARAIAAVFGAIGLTNLVLVAIIGSVAWRMQSLTVWLIYPCAVYALQGAAWLVAYMVRRRGWLLLVSTGWFVSSLAMAWFIQSRPGFVVAAGVGILACMVAPGWVMMRLSAKAA